MQVSLKIYVIEQSLIMNCHYERCCYKDSYHAEANSLINCFSMWSDYWKQGFANIQYCIFLLAWNPDLCPKYAMLDYDNAEIASVEEVFSDIQVFYVIFIGTSLGTGNCSSDTVVSHTSSYLIWFDNLPKNFAKFILTCAINLQELESNKAVK